MNNLPKDPVMLLSVVNTTLRDHYSSLDALCEAYEVEKSDIEASLNAINYIYNEAANQFK